MDTEQARESLALARKNERDRERDFKNARAESRAASRLVKLHEALDRAGIPINDRPEIIADMNQLPADISFGDYLEKWTATA